VTTAARRAKDEKAEKAEKAVKAGKPVKAAKLEKAAAPAKLRKDAQANRDRLLAVAVAAFTKDPNASLDGIAKSAGVGIGTLYRHYPTREALIEAAYMTELEKLCEAAPALLAKHPPDDALHRWLDRFIDYVSTKRGMIDALRSLIAAGRDPFNQSRARITDAIRLILEAGQSAGVLREDAVVDDILNMAGLFLPDKPEQSRRVAAILVDGLRFRAKRKPALTTGRR
jgi:AcrR family transcriptional regulator